MAIRTIEDSDGSKIKFGAEGKRLSWFAGVSTPENVAELLRDDFAQRIVDAIEYSKDDLNLEAVKCLKKVRTIIDFDRYIIEDSAPKSTKEYTHKVQFTLKTKDEDFRTLILGFGKRFGYEISGNAEKGIYIFGFDKDTLEELKEKTASLSAHVTITVVNGK